MSSKANVRWKIFFYPYANYYPDRDITYASADQRFDDKTESTGEIAFGYSRSMNSVEDTCSISVYGPVSKEMFKGNWAVLRSYGTNPSKGFNDNTEDDGAIEFIGQIDHISLSYTMDARGKVEQRSNIVIRSWAFTLKCPVKLDAYSLHNLVPSIDAAVITRAERLNKQQDGLSAKALLEISMAAYSSFEFVMTVLYLVGAMNKNKNYDTTVDMKKLKLPDVALSLPIIPPQLLKDVLPSTKDTDLNSAFGSGFLEFVSGINQGKVKGKQSSYIFDSFSSFSEIYSTSGTFRPKMSNIAMILQNGSSTWDLCSQMSDSSSNEMYCDFVNINVDGKSRAQPYMIVRDKPYMLKLQKDKEDLTAGWSTYDAVPRIVVPKDSITGIRIDDNFADVCNFYRTFYTNGSMISPYSNNAAALLSTKIDRISMDRYGGQPYYINTPYIDFDLTVAKENAEKDKGKVTSTKYSQELTTVCQAWYGDKVKQPNGTLFLKDTGILLSVGMNIQFEINGRAYVGHIVSFSKSHSVSSSGSYVTDVVVNFIRMCVVKDDGFLDFMDPELILDLYATTPEKPKKKDSSKKKATGGLISGFE